MTDFASEFQKVFSNSCPPTTDWSKPRPFDGINNECYQAEAALMSSLTSEAYNQFGFEVQYFIKKSSTEKDKLYGEDTLENFERRFRLKVYAENVPQLHCESFQTPCPRSIPGNYHWKTVAVLHRQSPSCFYSSSSL